MIPANAGLYRISPVCLEYLKGTALPTIAIWVRQLKLWQSENMVQGVYTMKEHPAHGRIVPV